MKTLRWVLAAQVLFFAAWGGYLLTTHRIAATVWLDTEPVDPRDLLSGHYVALAYRLTSSAGLLCGSIRAPGELGPVYLRLEVSPEPVLTNRGPVLVSRATKCQATTPTTGGIWIVGDRSARPGAARVTFGIERFYVSENNPLRWAGSGDVVAKIAINDDHEPRIIDLVPRVPLEDARAFESMLSEPTVAR